VTGTIGAEGEALARCYLEGQGLTFRAANVHLLGAEIDLVMEDPARQELVFVEVRARSGGAFGTPEESVTSRKRAALARAVAAYIARARWLGPYRLDFVGIRYGDAVPAVSHTTYVALTGDGGRSA
jgi:putative endonuclease